MFVRVVFMCMTGTHKRKHPHPTLRRTPLSLILGEESRDRATSNQVRESNQTHTHTHSGSRPLTGQATHTRRHFSASFLDGWMMYGLTTVSTPNWFPPSSNLGYWNRPFFFFIFRFFSWEGELLDSLTHSHCWQLTNCLSFPNNQLTGSTFNPPLVQITYFEGVDFVPLFRSFRKNSMLSFGLPIICWIFSIWCMWALWEKKRTRVRQAHTNTFLPS